MKIAIICCEIFLLMISNAWSLWPSLDWNCILKQCSNYRLNYMNCPIDNCFIDTKKAEEKKQKIDFPMDCSQILQNGQKESGVYNIWLKDETARRLQVFCDMDTDGGGWTVIQRRGNFWQQEDFFRDWTSYKHGFGNLNRDFWLGNHNLFVLSNQASYSVRFDLADATGDKSYAVYKNFKIEDESSKYRIHITDYSGNAGDAMKSHHQKKFSTKDNGNDDTNTGNQCAKYCKGGWWYANCYEANLNGFYKPGAKGDPSAIMWRPWRNNDGLFSSEIKLKRI